MGGPAYLTTAEIYMYVHEQTAISTELHPAKVLKRFVDKRILFYTYLYTHLFPSRQQSSCKH